MSHLNEGEYARGVDAHLHVAQLGSPLVGGVGVVIPATDATDRTKDLIIVVKSIATSGSGLPAGVKVKDIYIHRGAETAMVEGDQVYVVEKTETYPVTTVEATISPATTEIMTQKNKGWLTTIRTGSKNLTQTIGGFREKGNLLQAAVMGSNMRTASTSADGSAITFSDPTEVVCVLMAMNYDGQDDLDMGIASVVTFGDVPTGWSQDSVQEFTLNCLLSPIANPTLIQVSEM